ncbi:GIY-YIG nuclease family protein [Candidatus Gottesmanbacteria bacterium]|nr:GIY-YIG nuclease family protein [Candidatus Gottesmanbacteria bacterium]
MWFVYILLCQDRSLYTGIAKNPHQRFLEHKEGKGGKYTRSHAPLKIVYSEKCTTKSEALRRELAIKKWRRATKVLKLDIKLTR